MTAPLITITAYGQPAPQGSKRHVGRGIMVESSKAVKPWREAVKAAALDARGYGWAPVDAPLAVSMVFTMPKPSSAPKRRRTWPMRTPDLSKLIRSTEDALTDAGIWRDDARVVSYERTAKVYPGEGADSLTSPGVVIRIWLVDDQAPTTIPILSLDEPPATQPWGTHPQPDDPGYCGNELHGADGGACPGCGWDSHPIPTTPPPVVRHGDERSLPVPDGLVA